MSNTKSLYRVITAECAECCYEVEALSEGEAKARFREHGIELWSEEAEIVKVIDITLVE